MSGSSAARHIALIVHYFPPLNSAGGKRMEAMAKYFTRAGRRVTVITTCKTAEDGPLTEPAIPGVDVLPIDGWGRLREDAVSVHWSSASGPSTGAARLRRVKDLVMGWFGQLPDPRLPFSAAFGSPFLNAKVRLALCRADVVVASAPPWPTLLAAVFARWRFGCRVVMDYRDHFSECHEMPGSRLAKAVETIVDRWLCGQADRVVVVSDPMATYYRRWQPRVDVVLNGYDPEIFAAIRTGAAWAPRKAGEPVLLRYLGTVTPDRVPRSMIAALATLVRRGELARGAVRFEYYGDCALVEQHIRTTHPEIAPWFEFRKARPYREALAMIVQSDFLLFAENSSRITLSAQGVLTTKLFEYLAAGRPIVANIADTTLAGRLLRRAGNQHVVTTEESEFIAFFRSPAFLHPPATLDVPFVRTLSRSAQADEYLALLDRVCMS